MSESKSPFKNKPDFSGEKVKISPNDHGAAFWQNLVDFYWPAFVEPPKQPSRVKTGAVSKWEHRSATICDHLWDLKCHVERLCALGQLRSEEEHYIVLFESVQIPHTRDFLKKVLPNIQKAASKASELMHYLLRQYHIPAAERNALSELEALPVCTDVCAFVAQFDSLAVRIGDTFATDALKAHMFLKRLPASVRL